MTLYSRSINPFDSHLQIRVLERVPEHLHLRLAVLKKSRDDNERKFIPYLDRIRTLLQPRRSLAAASGLTKDYIIIKDLSTHQQELL